MHKSIKRLLVALLLLIISIASGVWIFVHIEGYTYQDAFYMAVITFSTVGFTEVHPLSEAGRLVTGIYIIVNFGIFAYIVSVFTSYFFEGELNNAFKRFIIGREVKKLNDHVIVCGFGRNGAKACEELYAKKISFVVVERQPDTIQQYQWIQGHQVIYGDATQDEVLEQAGIERANTLITTLPNDAENVFIALTAKEFNPKLKIIARASEEKSEKKLYWAGASHVIMPDALGGLHMAQLVTKPYVIEFLEMLNGINEEGLILEDFDINDLKKEFHGKSIREMDVRNKSGVTVIAFKLKQGSFDFNPSVDKVIGANEVIIVLGYKKDIDNFEKVFCV